MATIARREGDVKRELFDELGLKVRSEYRAVLAAFAIVAKKKQETHDRGVKSGVSCFVRFTEPPLKRSKYE